MGTVFGGGVFGGGGSTGGGTAGVPLGTGIIDPMLRIAGITTLPGTIPNVDQRGELVPMVARMLGSWNLDGRKIFTTSIAPYALNTDQKIYSIGPGGDFDADRPLYIKGADLLWPTSPIYRTQLRILDDDEWAAIPLQDITSAPPNSIYYDGGMDANGRGLIYIYFQPPAGYSLELYTWQALSTSFTSVDDIVVFPPGYEEALVWNGALRVAAMYPLEAKLNPLAAVMARDSLRALMTLNTQLPRIGTDPGLAHDRSGRDQGGRGWLTGGGFFG